VRKEFFDVLKCSILLEKNAAGFLYRISRIIDDEWSSMALRYIARESEDHAKILEDICRVYELYDLEIAIEEYKRITGAKGAEIIDRYKRIIEKLDSGWKPEREELLKILKEQTTVEKLAGEDIYVQFLLKLLEQTIDFKLLLRKNAIFKLLLKSISEEEEKRIELIKRVIERLAVNRL